MYFECEEPLVVTSMRVYAGMLDIDCPPGDQCLCMRQWLSLYGMYDRQLKKILSVVAEVDRAREDRVPCVLVTRHQPPLDPWRSTRTEAVPCWCESKTPVCGSDFRSFSA